jgi:hypothetical protein
MLGMTITDSKIFFYFVIIDSAFVDNKIYIRDWEKSIQNTPYTGSFFILIA